MAMARPHRIAVVGGGIAGTLLAEELVAVGHRPSIFVHPTLHLANTPVTGLMHPFPGRSMRPSGLLDAAVSTAVARYSCWHRLFPALCRPITMNRPLIGAGGSRLYRSYLEHWCEHSRSRSPPAGGTDSARIVDFEVELAPSEPSGRPTSIGYRPSFAIDAAELIAARHVQLAAMGCEIIVAEVDRVIGTTIEAVPGQYDGSGGGGGGGGVRRFEFEFDAVVLAVGDGLAGLFPGIDVVIEGGSLLSIPGAGVGVCLDGQAYSVNGLHVTPNRSGDAVIGSTRWPANHGSRPPPDGQHCRDALLGRARDLAGGGGNALGKGKAHPSAPADATCGSLWRGKRCSIVGADRLPVCGPVPGHPGVAVLGGLGNKGLLMGPIAAAALAGWLLDGRRIPAELDISRIPGSWASPRLFTAIHGNA